MIVHVKVRSISKALLLQYLVVRKSLKNLSILSSIKQNSFLIRVPLDFERLVIKEANEVFLNNWARGPSLNS